MFIPVIEYICLYKLFFGMASKTEMFENFNQIKISDIYGEKGKNEC